jgi:CDP-paratose 2-epimerase
MKLLITGACGFVGSELASSLLQRMEGLTITGIDNLMRPGSELNRPRLRALGVKVTHADIRSAADLDVLPPADLVIDAAANPSVLAGIGGRGSSRQLLENNLVGMVNVLEYCRDHSAGLILLSSSRVYSIPALAALPLVVKEKAFHLDCSGALPHGLTESGIGAEFSTEAPVSLYGSTKLASETLALEYGSAFSFPVWIDRCGVLAGAGQFGTPDQGIFAYWINAHLRKRALRYIGFGGEGHQVRDAFHPRDLAALIASQLNSSRSAGQRLYTAGGGTANAISLANLTAWCDARFGAHAPTSDSTPRAYDIPWIVMDSSDAERDFGWQARTPLDSVLEEIAEHGTRNPDWLELSGA